MNKTIKRILVGISAVLLGITAIRPMEVKASEAKTVRVGYYENEVFQEGASEGAVKNGYAYEYYRKLSEYTGWKYEYVYGDFSTLYDKFLNGEIDLMAGLAYLPERENAVCCPDRAMGTEDFTIVKHDDDDNITSDAQSLQGKKIGVLDSAMVSMLREFLMDREIEADVKIYSSYDDLFEAFYNLDIDLLATEGDGTYGRTHMEVLYVFGSTDYYLCTGKDRKDLLKELNIAQAQLASDEPDYISYLKNKYYSVSLSSRSYSASEKEWIADHNNIRVGYLNNYLPYSDTDRTGNVTGAVCELVPRLMNSIGLGKMKVEYVGYDNYDDMIASMQNESIDVAFPVGGGLYYSEENEIYQSSPVISSSTEIIYSGTYSHETISHFAVNENNRMQYYFIKTYFPDAEITFYDNIEDCLAAVMDGEAGCTTLNGLRVNDILKNSKYRSLSFRQLNINDDRCFGVSIGNEGLLKIINRSINVFGQDNIQNIAYRYTDLLYQYTLMDTLRENGFFIGGMFVLLTALVIFLLIRDILRSKKIHDQNNDLRSL